MPAWIHETDSFIKFADELARENIIAVDTESNSLYAYQEQICLIQVTAAGGDFLLDPLALQNLTPLGEVLKNPDIEKVFHAAEYDLICLQRDFGFRVNNLFDTMIAAGILGYKGLGLGKLLEVEMSVKLDKHNQRANWGVRPLSQQLLTYAQMDTHYLIELRNRLRQKLVERNLLALAEEDFLRMSAGRPKESAGDHPTELRNGYWRINGSLDLDPQHAAILVELYGFRDREARRQNKPLFRIMHDRSLLELAKAAPRTREDLLQVPEVSRKQADIYGDRILKVVAAGLKAKSVAAPRRFKPDPRFLNRLDALRCWRKATAQKLGVNSDVVLPRDLMETLAEKNPVNLEDLEKVMSAAPWRFQHYGDQILQILRGKGM